MKSLLAILLSFALLEMPVFAIHGGYTLGGASSLQGTYAGTFIPISDTPENGNTATFGTNSLGLFTLNVPNTGVASGVVVVFSAGRSFFGTLEGLPDPKNPNGLVGIVNATFDYNILLPSTTISGSSTLTTFSSTAVTASAEGSFSAQTSTSTITSSASPTGIDLNGTATVDISQGEVLANGAPDVTDQVVFTIDGFQQSASFTPGKALTSGSGG